MNIDYLDEQDVQRHLTMPACIELMADTQVAISRGEVLLPLRHSLGLNANKGSLLIMSGEMIKKEIFGVKLISVFPANPAAGHPAIQGGILLFDSHKGSPLALVEAASITAYVPPRQAQPPPRFSPTPLHTVWRYWVVGFKRHLTWKRCSPCAPWMRYESGVVTSRKQRFLLPINHPSAQPPYAPVSPSKKRWRTPTSSAR